MAITARDIMRGFLETATPKELEEWADAGLRHKRGKRPFDYLRHWLNIGRHFGYATRDESWGEFEKIFCIMVKRLVVAERDLEQLRAHPALSAQLADRCPWCGTEKPSLADRYLCRESPCRLSPTPEQEEGK